MIAVAIFYSIQFFGNLGYGFAYDSASWGQFGDYMGGVLNPLLSFISITLLVKSLNLQNQSNQDLREELHNNKKAEKLKSFSIQFFSMISSQKAQIENFAITNINFPKLSPGVATVIFIEDEIEQLRNAGADDTQVRNFVRSIDDHDKIFSILRAFYITVKIVSEKLSDSNEFTVDDRKNYLLTLINFTDFAQLRLIIIGIQFIECPASNYLRDNSEFAELLIEVNLKLDLY